MQMKSHWATDATEGAGPRGSAALLAAGATVLAAVLTGAVAVVDQRMMLVPLAIVAALLIVARVRIRDATLTAFVGVYAVSWLVIDVLGQGVSYNDVTIALDAFVVLLAVCALGGGKVAPRSIDPLTVVIVVCVVSFLLSYIANPTSPTLLLLSLRTQLRAMMLAWATSRLILSDSTARRLVVLVLAIAALQIPVSVFQFVTMTMPRGGPDLVTGTFGSVYGNTTQGWYLPAWAVLMVGLAASGRVSWRLAGAASIASMVVLWMGASLLGFMVLPLALAAVGSVGRRSARTRMTVILLLLSTPLIPSMALAVVPTSANFLSELGAQGGQNLGGLWDYIQYSVFTTSYPTSRWNSILLTMRLTWDSGGIAAWLGNGPGATYLSRVFGDSGSIATAYPWPNFPFIWALDFQRTMVELGLMGLISLLMFFYVAFRSSWQLYIGSTNRFWSGIGLGFTLVVLLSLTQMPYQAPLTSPIVAYTFGLLLGLVRSRDLGQSSPTLKDRTTGVPS